MILSTARKEDESIEKVGSQTSQGRPGDQCRRDESKNAEDGNRLNQGGCFYGFHRPVLRYPDLLLIVKIYSLSWRPLRANRNEIDTKIW